MKLTLRVIAILSFIIAITWMIYSPGFEPLLAFLAGITTLILSFVGGNEKETETLDQRNRRILLNHVENFWVKGVLEKSLHGAAMLELGIKEDPEAVTYPWAIKKEETGETLPAGTSMLEIFEQIGMGRSLLILGAPGSGKTTMLLELARQLIERARQNADEPIPMVFNLSSWTETKTLADWLAQELNNIYYVPRKTAPNWVKGNKLLLLLDGLDEVRQENRAKCVDAINQFRKEYGLTSLAVCSRSQDYEELGAKLAFDGAIEVQPLTQKQVNEFFNRFGKETAELKSVIEKDSTLREMAETPLFLSIMVIAYRDKRDLENLTSQDENAQRENLFNQYVARMLEHHHIKNPPFTKQDSLHYLSWLATKMIEHNQVPYFLETMQPNWLSKTKRIFQWPDVIWILYEIVVFLFLILIFDLLGGLFLDLFIGLFLVLSGVLLVRQITAPLNQYKITMVDAISWNWIKAKDGLIVGLITWLFVGLSTKLIVGLIAGLITGLIAGLSIKNINHITYPGQRLIFTMKNFLFTSLPFGLICWLAFGLNVGLLGGLIFGLMYGGLALIQFYILRFFLARSNLLPWKLLPFLDYCTDLIFLRRVGGGYIFVHRLLMEHFAAMYREEEV